MPGIFHTHPTDGETIESSKHLAQDTELESEPAGLFLLAVATMASPTVLIHLPLPKAAGDQRQVSSLPCPKQSTSSQCFSFLAQLKPTSSRKPSLVTSACCQFIALSTLFNTWGLSL